MSLHVPESQCRSDSLAASVLSTLPCGQRVFFEFLEDMKVVDIDDAAPETHPRYFPLAPEPRFVGLYVQRCKRYLNVAYVEWILWFVDISILVV